MISVNTSGWRGFSLNGQSILQYDLPGGLNDRMTATLFLKGPVLKNTGGCPEKIARAIFAGEAINPKLVAPRQQHGIDLVEAEAENAIPSRPDADAVLITTPGILGSLRFADCIPVVGVSEDPFDWCLLVHSGFLGTCRGAVREAVQKTVIRTGLQGVLHSHFWVGPGIGPCCYTRNAGDPLTDTGVRNLPSECWHRVGDKIYFDLPSANITLLYDMGIPEENIHFIDICTSCSTDLCHSYRRGDISERSFLLAGIHSRFHKMTHWWDNMI